MTATIHAELDHKHLLPTEHIVDTGYVDIQRLVESRRNDQIDLMDQRERMITGRLTPRL